MIIQNSSVSLSAAYLAESRESFKMSFRSWAKRPLPGAQTSTQPGVDQEPRIASRVFVSNFSQTEALQASENVTGDPKLTLAKLIIERFFGVKVRVCTIAAEAESVGAQNPASTETGAARTEGPGAELHIQQSISEKEVSDFHARGMVETLDGRRIAFNAQLTMAREFNQNVTLDAYAGSAKPKDPLVINLDGQAAALTGATFAFDLDGDGKMDSMRVLNPGSGYLALDRNQDGNIQSGDELFGPRSGDGFSELAHEDADRNGWIDEADPVFSRLSLWQPTAGGENTLTPLSATPVGAIFLGSVATPFHLNDASNQTQGIVRETGIYLTQDGQTGTIQQLDLVV